MKFNQLTTKEIYDDITPKRCMESLHHFLNNTTRGESIPGVLLSLQIPSDVYTYIFHEYMIVPLIVSPNKVIGYVHVDETIQPKKISNDTVECHFMADIDLVELLDSSIGNVFRGRFSYQIAALMYSDLVNTSLMYNKNNDKITTGCFIMTLNTRERSKYMKSVNFGESKDSNDNIKVKTDTDDIRVELINPEEVKNLVKNHGVFACTCYGTDDKFADRVGKSCQQSGHTSGSRCEYIKFRISGLDRGIAEQVMRHEIGVRYDNQDKEDFDTYMEMVIDENPANIVKNMQSLRYTNPNNFAYSTPSNIQKSERANKKYADLMKQIDVTRQEIRDILIEDGIDENRATEDANYCLPRATNMTLTIGFTIEALTHFMNKRLCTRAQEFNRKLALKMKKAVEEVAPELAKNFVPHCEHLLWCPEGKKSCKRYPTRDQMLKILESCNKKAD